MSDQQRQRYAEQAKKCETRFLYQALKLMNQCDINYRQSSNKRLLVELTLIEVAQITQPDDEGASAGRRPRRLKSLFKQLIRQSQPKQAAPQVAAAKTGVSPMAPKAKATNIEKPSPTPTKLGGIGFSWSNLRGSAKPSSKFNQIPSGVAAHIETVTDAEFSQEDLELQWMSMCNRMPQELSGIATRMKNMNPVITEFPNVEVAADNQIALEQLEQIKGSIVSTLKLYLHNKSITLSLRLAEHEAQMPILSRREQYELMEKENPSIGKLRELLSLELA